MDNRWQAPGNGKGFDSSFENWHGHKMSERSIGALQYIMTHANVTQGQFENNIWEYLHNMYGHEINDSCKSHFFRPIEFFGFIRHYDNLLSVSLNGRNFIKELESKNYDKVRESFILQLFNTKYPNTATRDVKISLYPFRIIFKLFSDNDVLTVEDFEYRIPYILSADDCYDFKNKHSDLYKRGIENGRYDKLKTWVINSFVDLNLIVKNGENYELSPFVDSFIFDLVKTIDYKDMFYTNDLEENIIRNKIVVNVKRDSRVIYDALLNNHFKCYFNDEHITFKTDKFENFVEGHHIIPMGYQRSFNLNLDIVDNVIPLCPNCHRMIHLAKDEVKRQYLDIIFNKKDKLLSFDNMTKEDLYELYCNS